MKCVLAKECTIECCCIRMVCMQCPLLCKEFIIDAWQLYYARLHGADAVLLIAAVLPDQDLQYMLKIVHALGMAALIEVRRGCRGDLSPCNSLGRSQSRHEGAEVLGTGTVE